MKNLLKVVLAGSVLTIFAGAAVAQTYYGQDGRVHRYPGGYEGRSAQQSIQQEYGESGTLGRMGLGADPRHPEGPGNVASPSVR